MEDMGYKFKFQPPKFNKTQQNNWADYIYLEYNQGSILSAKAGGDTDITI